MANTATKVIQFNRINELTQEYLAIKKEFNAFNENARKELSYYELHCCNSVITEIVKNSKSELPEETLNSVGEEKLQKIANIKRYSYLNPLVWIRLTSRKQKQIKGKKGQFQRRLNSILKETRELMSHFALKHTKRGQENYEKADTLRYNIEIFMLTDMDINFMPLDEIIACTFSGNRTISKHELLQLITINHDRYYWDGVVNDTQQRIAKLPDQINYKEFEKAVFAYKLEHDKDDSFFEIFFNRFLKAIDENPELSDKTFESFQEIFGPVQTYTANTDESGHIVKLNPNKPDLKVVK